MRGILGPKLPVALATVAGALALAPAAAAQSPAYETVVVEGGLDQPTYADDAPGFPQLLFVTEQAGVVRVLSDEEPLGEPFLDISDLVQSGGEEGLLSVAFPPDYLTSRRFYVYFTNNAGDIEVDEFKRKRSLPTEARRTSRRQVIVVPTP